MPVKPNARPNDELSVTNSKATTASNNSHHPGAGNAPADKSVRVTVSEAARLFGVNPRTIRRAINSGELRYIVVQERYKIHFGSLVNWSQRKMSIQHKRDTKGIGQWIDAWKIKNPKFSPRAPGE